MIQFDRSLCRTTIMKVFDTESLGIILYIYMEINRLYVVWGTLIRDLPQGIVQLVKEERARACW